MTVPNSIDVLEMLRKLCDDETTTEPVKLVLESAVNALMNSEANAICGAGLGERTAERLNHRNGYRTRQWDTRMGSIDLAIPKLRQGTYYPGWLLEPRRRAEKALTAVISEAYLLGVSTRKVEASRTSRAWLPLA